MSLVQSKAICNITSKTFSTHFGIENDKMLWVLRGSTLQECDIMRFTIKTPNAKGMPHAGNHSNYLRVKS